MEADLNSARPPFLLTYWNPFNEKAPGLGQSYLNYIKDISVANYTANATGSLVGAYIENANNEQISVLQHSFAFLDQRLTGIRQEKINTNILLQNIGLLLKLPDSEKQRQLHIERGIKFSTQSLKDDDIAIDAKNELDGALKLMPQDWFVLQQLGILLLYNEKVLDISTAKEYFLKAAKYANADSETEGVTFINNLFIQNLSFPFPNRDNTQNGLKTFVREAYLNAALAAYILADFGEAANISKKAVNINSEDSKSLFFAAKYLARNKNEEEALKYLIKAITNGPYLCVAASIDQDLKIIPEAIDFCNKFSADFFAKIELIKTRVDEIKEFINNSIVFQLKNEIGTVNYLVKGSELLQQSLFDENAEYHGKDPLFNEALTNVTCINLGRIVANYSDFENLMINGKFPLYNDLSRQKRIFDQIKNAGFIMQGTYKGQPALGYDSSFLLDRESVIESLDIKLNGYVVKDLYDKWDEITEILARKKRKEKEKELKIEEENQKKLEKENQKLMQKKKDEELFGPISDLYKNKNFRGARDEIKKSKIIYPNSSYLNLLDLKIKKELEAKQRLGWIWGTLIFSLIIPFIFVLSDDSGLWPLVVAGLFGGIVTTIIIENKNKY